MRFHKVQFNSHSLGTPSLPLEGGDGALQGLFLAVAQQACFSLPPETLGDPWQPELQVSSEGWAVLIFWGDSPVCGTWQELWDFLWTELARLDGPVWGDV